MGKGSFGSVSPCVGLVVNAPAVFARADFMAWLNNRDIAVFTWHAKGAAAGEYSDVIALIDVNYEGDSAGMPDDIWRAICDLAYDHYGGVDLPQSQGAHVVVRLTNLAS